MYLSIPPGVRLEAKVFDCPLGRKPVQVNERQDFFPVGIFKVQTISVFFPGLALGTPWIVVSDLLQKGTVLGQVETVVRYWISLSNYGIRLGDSLYGRVEQLSLLL